MHESSNQNSTIIKLAIGAALCISILSACSDKKGGNSPAGTRSDNSYLYVSPPDFYFGTKNVGSTSTQAVQIANRGADVYQLTSTQITGNLNDTDSTDYNPDEFAADILNDIVLQPSDAVSIDVRFKPITKHQKKANLVVNYIKVKAADEADNQTEQSYYRGFDHEKAGQFREAKKSYSEYINNDPVTINKRRAAIKLPIIDESETYGSGQELTLYLSAMDQRDAGDFNAALQTLEGIDRYYEDSYLADDALYLTGYIHLMDKKDLRSAQQTMEILRKKHPDTTYYDTSLYSQAMANIELGNDTIALNILQDLRDRHTGFIAFGVAFPKDNLVSRLWFERADETLQSMTTS